MQNEPFSHKTLDFVQNMWPLISGVFIVMVAGTKLWWQDRKDTKNRIKNLEILAEQTVYKTDLHDCREDVRLVDNGNMDKITKSISDLRDHNDKQHSEVMNHIIKLSGK